MGVNEDFKIYVTHAGVLQQAQDVVKQLQKTFENTVIEIYELSPVLLLKVDQDVLLYKRLENKMNRLLMMSLMVFYYIIKKEGDQNELSRYFGVSGSLERLSTKNIRSIRYFEEGSENTYCCSSRFWENNIGNRIIRLVNQPTLILVPTITIRQQWVSRINEAFLKKGLKSEDYISQDLKHLKLINVATYQSIHSAMKKVSQQDDEENMDYQDYSLIDAVREAGIQTFMLR